VRRYKEGSAYAAATLTASALLLIRLRLHRLDADSLVAFFFFLVFLPFVAFMFGSQPKEKLLPNVPTAETTTLRSIVVGAVCGGIGGVIAGLVVGLLCGLSLLLIVSLTDLPKWGHLVRHLRHVALECIGFPPIIAGTIGGVIGLVAGAIERIRPFQHVKSHTKDTD
jgi:hypothetical protein